MSTFGQYSIPLSKLSTSNANGGQGQLFFQLIPMSVKYKRRLHSTPLDISGFPHDTVFESMEIDSDVFNEAAKILLKPSTFSGMY
jgi:hypothetical protein